MMPLALFGSRALAGLSLLLDGTLLPPLPCLIGTGGDTPVEAELSHLPFAVAIGDAFPDAGLASTADAIAVVTLPSRNREATPC